MSLGGTPSYLSPAQIAGVATEAGFPPSALPTAVAVALAESGGGNTNALDNTSNPSAPNYHTPGEGDSPEFSEGLFQINVLAHPSYASEDLANPLTNAEAAEQIWAADGWSPWSTYTQGTYENYLGAATQGAQAPAQVSAAQAAALEGAGGGTPTSTSATGASTTTAGATWYEPWTWGSAVSSSLSQFGSDILDGLATLMFAGAGLGMVVVGVAMLGNPEARKAAQQLPAVSPEVIEAGAAAA